MLSSAVAVRPEEIKKRINSEKKLLTTTIYTYEFDQVYKKKKFKKRRRRYKCIYDLAILTSDRYKLM